MNPSDYVQWLLQANLSQLSLADDSDFGTLDFISTFGFGLLEEFQEYKADASPLEAGDVLAYYVLLSVSLGFTRPFVAERLTNLSHNFVLEPPLLTLAGSLKRLFRGDGSSSAVEAGAYNLLSYVVSNCGVPVEALAQLNRTKLELRLANTGTFEGKGDR